MSDTANPIQTFPVEFQQASAVVGPQPSLVGGTCEPAKRAQGRTVTTSKLTGVIRLRFTPRDPQAETRGNSTAS